MVWVDLCCFVEEESWIEFMAVMCFWSRWLFDQSDMSEDLLEPVCHDVLR